MSLFSEAIKSFNSVLPVFVSPLRPDRSQSPFERLLPKDVKVLSLSYVSFRDLARFEVASVNCKEAAAIVWIQASNNIAPAAPGRTVPQAKEIVKKYYSKFHALPTHLFHFFGGFDAVLDYPKSYCMKEEANFPKPQKNTIIKIKLSFKELKNFAPPNEEDVVSEFTGTDLVSRIHERFKRSQDELYPLLQDPEGRIFLDNLYKFTIFDPKPANETQVILSKLKEENPKLFNKYFKDHPLQKKYFAAVVEVQESNNINAVCKCVYFNGQFAAKNNLNSFEEEDVDFAEIICGSLKNRILKNRISDFPPHAQQRLNLFLSFNERDPLDQETLSNLHPIAPEFKDTVMMLWNRLVQ